MKKFSILLFLLFTINAFAQNYNDYISSGLDSYARSDWPSAVFSFQKAMEVSKNSLDEPLYWLIMANTSAGNYSVALSDVEVFFKRFPNSSKTAEIMYQQGRICCLSAKHDQSINILYGFLRKYPNHRQAASAYYWIGENLYMVGRLKDARTIFSRVIIDYPSSAKVEPSRYKIALIDQASTQDELLKLLKISHEELLKLSEEFEKNKKIYEQTIAAYQRQSADAGGDIRIAELSEQLKMERKRNEELYDKFVMLELKNQELSAALANMDSKYTPEIPADGEPAEDYSDPEKRRAALEALLKKAKILQSMYDQLLEENN
ncbi:MULTISPECIES: tetratricopeptide repeat protein [unclassified Treponema]|uniref:tetratricopeptide repeat protein n=1 Tax=unclassified Treponema TaxID=2638727 RepID=UPI0020A3B6AD|nr:MULTISPECIES: tetratricopeptide repeat protein [unclassified Treponema]UTC66368.1 tetratricopeptide repeat protein [Treponema sp. OMZ 789]UTC69098.1 tetratricopeptide repeat protein [Treponema sp. OMZ 790]UTC71810.1 tetratricopeptide repeat protein [Treponema sp. OMZ 791]